MRVTGIDRWVEFLFREVEHVVEFFAVFVADPQRVLATVWHNEEDYFWFGSAGLAPGARNHGVAVESVLKKLSSP
jgi:hypothetical protein